MQPFTYGFRRASDRARVLQQNGVYPPEHVFTPEDGDMCEYPECYAGKNANVPWHIPAPKKAQAYGSV